MKRPNGMITALTVLLWLSSDLAFSAVPSPLTNQSPSRVRLFNIPASPLHEALEKFSAVTATALIYNSALADKRRSKPVVGLFSPEVALRMMLEGSDLTIRYNSPTDIMLVSLAEERTQAVDEAVSGSPAAAELSLDTLHVEVAPGAEGRSDFTSYSQVVVRELKRTLGRNPDTSNRIYQVSFDVWVSDQGQLRHPRFVRSTGRATLDAAIRRVVEDTTLKILPPKGMPQPLRLTIVAL